MIANINAETEYDKYKALKGPDVSLVEVHFESLEFLIFLKIRKLFKEKMVGVTGIEPATSCTPSKHATTALHPENRW